MQPALPLILMLAVAGFCGNLMADSITMKPVADTTLIQLVPDNNMGAHPFFNAGSTLHGSKNRGLLRFDLASNIPKGSRITSALLTLEVVGIPIDEPAGANFRLHRMLRNWGEGEKVSSSSPGRGELATVGEATWNHRFALTTNNWSTPGGETGADYVSPFTSEQFIDPINNQPYTFGGPASQMTPDVQLWVNNPEQNFGWLLKVEDETTTTTARRFAASEDENYAPLLAIEFDPPPLLQLTNSGSFVHLSFQTRTNESYELQRSTSLNPTNWAPLTNFVSSSGARTITATNAISANTGFYRLLISE